MRPPTCLRNASPWIVHLITVASLTHPPIILSNRHGELKRFGRQIERSPSSSAAEISNVAKVKVKVHSCVRLVASGSIEHSVRSAVR